MHGRLLTRLRPDGCALLLAVCATVGTALVLAREWKFGVALHSDSVFYISVARSLLAGDGFMQFIWGPLTMWPPLYPLLLAAATFFIFDPHEVAGVVNAVIFGLTILLVGRWLRQQLKSRFLVLWACLATMLSIPMVREASWAMSEPLFILMTFLSLMHMERFIRDGLKSSLLWASALAACACLTRYMGVALICASLLLLISQRRIEVFQKMLCIGLYMLISLVPISLWILRNFLLIGQVHATREGVAYSVPDIMDGVFRSLASWVNPDWSEKQISFAADFLLAHWLILATIICYLTFRIQANWRGFFVFGVFVLTYPATLAVAMILGNTWTAVQPRFLTPIYLPLLLMVAFTADNFLMHSKAKEWPRVMQHTAKFALYAPLCLWLGYSAALQAGQIRRELLDGPEHSLTNSKWTKSQTIQYMQEVSGEGPIYSNDVVPLYIHSDPKKTHHYLRQQENHLRRLAENAENGAYIVWFYDWWVGGKFHYNEFHLRSLPGAKVVASFFDGIILHLSPNGQIDEEVYHANKAKYAREIINSAGRKAINSNFAVHIGHDALTYIKESCTKADTAAKFFLHIWPTAKCDLPEHRRRYGFDNLDFEFDRRGFQFAGRCAARINLPEYRIVRIATGQWETGQGRIWEGEIAFP